MAWLSEVKNAGLTKLPPNFYIEVEAYLRELEERSSTEKEPLIAKLILEEFKSAKALVREIRRLRHEKIMAKIVKEKPFLLEELASEKRVAVPKISVSTEQELLKRTVVQQEVSTTSRKRIFLRFLKETPAIVGRDLKVYGPFKPEDVASLPLEDGENLVKHGFASKILLSSPQE